MEIKVRGVDPVVVKTINELADAKKISRNEYLKEVLHGVAAMHIIKATEDKYEQLVQSLVALLIQNTEALENVNQRLKELESNDGYEKENQFSNF